MLSGNQASIASCVTADDIICYLCTGLPVHYIQRYTQRIIAKVLYCECCDLLFKWKNFCERELIVSSVVALTTIL